ncbi:hypothetical protein [Undibacterium sp. SXout20W]|uniref:hypothetical protein n=1 Tax=Undibacterium sp. SXout20W TaxID=3413051 RepID=UPI003BF0D7FD
MMTKKLDTLTLYLNSCLSCLSCLKGLGTLLFSGVLCVTASAQTAPPVAEQTTPVTSPLNADSIQVVKEISKELNSSEIKPTVLTNTHDEFEKSLLQSENRKKVFGVAEVGATTGSLPAQHGYKSESFNCANAAVAVTDEISKTAQVSVTAQVEKCKFK